ncbi:efflux RND transporter periplasmic adaptor subunit [Nocardioides bruguierae]|uniref:Biotin/lipoyl-binding protein n=1 Tax=Nocardioides bruguierae TaxID=2945102 RepID=A0A9X2DA84_9ACTN|nr:biotin/lipoyl-binding protein [Nocardioides bruguierae]MCL8027073.1 biotin/lipoyl-binding protein [Nocardioides bruguierae]MCM0622211.1 biotin/lipoyl-binding protein [Nocardioides bruguierae]
MRLRLPRRPKILVAAGVVLLLVVAGGVGAWLLTRDTEAAATTSTATVSTQTISETVSSDGTVAAARSRSLSFSVSGTVTKVTVDAGDTVKKGQVLAVVDDDSLVAARKAAQAQLTAAQAQLSEDVDADADDIQLASDRATVVTARASLADARTAVSEAVLRATISGTVTSVGISKGDVVGSSSSSGGTDASGSSSSSSSGGTIDLVSTGRFVVDGTVAATDADSVTTGLQVEITVSGVDDTVYGTVSEIGLVAETDDSGAAVFPVTVQVTGTRDDVYAGTSATMEIIVSQRTDVLTVDSTALTTEGDATYVTVLVDGVEEQREVTVGETYGRSTEITDGLSEGDEVVVQGFTAPTGSGDDSGQQGQMPDMSGGGMPDMSGGQMPGGQG